MIMWAARPTLFTPFVLFTKQRRRVQYKAYSFKKDHTEAPFYWSMGQIGDKQRMLPLLTTEGGQVSVVTTAGKSHVSIHVLNAEM